MSYKYPVYQPSLGARETENVLECLQSTWISSKGIFIERFEKEFSNFVDCTHSISVANGTVAIHLALVALGIVQGDEVIVPTFTYVASVNAIAYTGAKPVFVDSNIESWQLDVDDVERKITPKTKAVMAVHLYGQPCDMDKLVALCRKHNLFLIEDCAEAFGSRFNGKHVGTFGDIATFSFFGNKTITTGEGGMVVTMDDTLADRCKHFRGQGLAKDREYWHDVIGFNYRMTNICAAIGLAQLERANEIIAKKRELAAWYKEFLQPLQEVLVHKEMPNTTHSYWMVTILVENSAVRDSIRLELKNGGVETRPAFYPVHTMPMYDMPFQQHKNAEFLGWRGINLPSYPNLTKNDVQVICAIITKFYEKN